MGHMTVGIEFLLRFGVPLAGGLLLDIHLDTKPGFTVLGALIGFAVAVRRLIRQGKELQREEEEERRKERQEDERRPGPE